MGVKVGPAGSVAVVLGRVATARGGGEAELRFVVAFGDRRRRRVKFR